MDSSRCAVLVDSVAPFFHCRPAVGVGVGVGAVGAASLPLAFGSTSQGGVVKNHRINKSRGADAAAVVHDNEW